MTFPEDQKFFIWDAESVGLHGQSFAVAGGIYDVKGTAEREFGFHCCQHEACGSSDRMAGNSDDRDWVAANVTVRPDSIRTDSVQKVHDLFWIEWGMAKEKHPGILMFVECGWPVEARFLMFCIARDPDARKWEGPYPMHEIATMMLAAGMDPMATYERRPDELPAHEPLADSRLSARLLSEAIHRLHEIGEAFRNSARSAPTILGLSK